LKPVNNKGDLPSHPKNFHHFVAEVVDDFDGDAAVEGGGEGPGYGSVKG